MRKKTQFCTYYIGLLSVFIEFLNWLRYVCHASLFSSLFWISHLQFSYWFFSSVKFVLCFVFALAVWVVVILHPLTAFHYTPSSVHTAYWSEAVSQSPPVPSLHTFSCVIAKRHYIRAKPRSAKNHTYLYMEHWSLWKNRRSMIFSSKNINFFPALDGFFLDCVWCGSFLPLFDSFHLRNESHASVSKE